MHQPAFILGSGTVVVTHDVLGSTGGFLVRADYLRARRPGARVTLRGPVSGHGGDVYWAEHEDGSIAVYGWPEFELAESHGSS